jgi:hypothetical protein
VRSAQLAWLELQSIGQLASVERHERALLCTSPYAACSAGDSTDMAWQSCQSRQMARMM